MKLLSITVLAGCCGALAMGKPIGDDAATRDIKPMSMACPNPGMTGKCVEDWTWSLDQCEGVIQPGLYDGFESFRVFDGSVCDVFAETSCAGTKRHLIAATYPNVGFTGWSYRCSAA